MPFDLGVLSLVCLLRVATYNVHYGGDHDGVLAAIAATDADVVLLQETTPSWERALRRRFGERYPHMSFHHWRRSPGGLAVLSRHRIDVDELIPPAASWFPAQRAVIVAPDGPVQVLHVHLRPAIERGDWVRGFFSTPPIRLREIRAYWKRMARELPTLVAGDFNEEPGATALGYLVERGLTRADSGDAPTWQWKGLWKGAPVHLRMKLDHVLVDGRWRVEHAGVIAGGGSDHQPVVVRLQRR